MAHSCNHCCSGKAISITQPQCVCVAFVIQHAMGMCHIVIVACVFRFPLLLLSETFFILGRNERDIIIKYILVSCQVPIILVQFLTKFKFPQQIFEKYSNIKFTKICPVEAELFHADRQTDMAKLIVALCNSVSTPNKCTILQCLLSVT